jgi:SAM-dependent methyltransferase
MSRLNRAWEDWAQIDPHYAVLSDRDRWNGAWKQEIEEFFRSGTAEVESLVEQAKSLGYPRSCGRALDFGCGLGRVTQALAPVFQDVLGVDVSETMVAEARKTHQSLVNVRFLRVSHPREVGPAPFDLVWSILVLQHLGSSAAIADSLDGLAALVASGGLLVIEIPHSAPPLGWRGRVRVRTRVYQAMRLLGVPPTTLRRRLGLSPPMTMSPLPEDRVRAILSKRGLNVLAVRAYDGVDGGNYRRYTATRPDGERMSAVGS